MLFDMMISKSFNQSRLVNPRILQVILLEVRLWTYKKTLK